MAIESTVTKTKLQLKYEDGSKTYSNCKIDATDESIFNTAGAIAALQNQEVEQIIKVVESEIVETV